MSRNFILMATSTLNGEIRSNDYTTPEGGKIWDCQSQLEPVIRYILTKCAGEKVHIVSLCTKDAAAKVWIKEHVEEKEGKTVRKKTVEKKNPGNTDGSPVTETSAQKFFMDRIMISQEAEIPEMIDFDTINIDLKQPEEAIQRSIEKIMQYEGMEVEDEKDRNIRIWIDNHGGLRDIALLLNAVGFLLEMDSSNDLYVEAVYGVNTAQITIEDQKNAFMSLHFVSGMSDFINFGNVDVLYRYYQDDYSGGNEEIRALINAMRQISDGTQFCDPYLYIQGLDALAETVRHLNDKSLEARQALLPIFYKSIVDDYGILLDRGKRTSLDIIDRCVKKKQYQQALTFIEALMPQYFFDRKILYCDEEDYRKLEEAVKDSYESPVNYMYNCFLEKMNSFPKGDIRENLSVKAAILAGLDNPDDLELSASEMEEVKKTMGSEGLKTNMIKRLPLSRKLKLGGGIQLRSRISDLNIDKDKKNELYYLAAEILRIHDTLKRSRNKFNHAVSSDAALELKNRRPRLEDTVKLMNLYIEKINELEGRLQ